MMHDLSNFAQAGLPFGSMLGPIAAAAVVVLMARLIVNAARVARLRACRIRVRRDETPGARGS